MSLDRFIKFCKITSLSTLLLATILFLSLLFDAETVAAQSGILPNASLLGKIKGEWSLPCSQPIFQNPDLAKKIGNFSVIQKISFFDTGNFESQYLLYKDANCKELLRVSYSSGSFDMSELYAHSTGEARHYLEILHETMFALSKDQNLDRFNPRYHAMVECPQKFSKEADFFTSPPKCFKVDVPTELKSSNYVALQIGQQENRLFMRQSFFSNSPNTGLNLPHCFMEPVQDFQDFVSLSKSIERSNTPGTFCYRFKKGGLTDKDAIAVR